MAAAVGRTPEERRGIYPRLGFAYTRFDVRVRVSCQNRTNHWRQ